LILRKARPPKEEHWTPAVGVAPKAVSMMWDVSKMLHLKVAKLSTLRTLEGSLWLLRERREIFTYLILMIVW
jgi:hypothetical protein